jgi:nicotinate-nucleotide--dimethylbenzimidazole phosphoribosyltransferase
MSTEVTSALPAPLPDPHAGRDCAALLSTRGDGLGRLAAIGGWIAGVQGSCPPRPFRRIRAVLVSAPRDDAVAAADPTLDRAPVLDALTAAVGATRRLVEVASVSADDAGSRAGVPELTAEEFEAAHELGRYIADEEADSGTDLVVVGSGATSREADITAATTLVAALLGREPVAMIGTDTGPGSATGLDGRAWTRRVVATRDALRRTRVVPLPDDAGLLRLVGGPRIAVLTGLLRQCAVRRTPVLLDGAVSCAAALAAERLSPGSRRWWSATATSPEPAATAALAELLLRPLLDLGVRTGDGSAALLAVPVLTAAIDAALALGDQAATGSADA